MKYLADTLIDHIWKELETRREGVFRFVLPAYPSDILVRIGVELDDRVKRTLDRTIALRYGIPFRLGQEWRNSSAPKEKRHFDLIAEKGWYNESDNLTSLRNLMRNESTDCLVIVLAGYEYIHDKESLRDFFRLDQQSVWESCLNRSFVPWIEQALRNYVNTEDSLSDFTQMSDFLRSVYDLGLADLVTISSYLERLDTEFRDVMVGSDAYRVVLGDLGDFGLPNLQGLCRGRTRKNPSKYITSAHEFFNYTMFLEARDRERARKRIDLYRRSLADKDSPADDLEKSDLGPFGSVEELLDVLKTYIDTGRKERLSDLKKVDFTFILDKVLGFKTKTDPVERHRPKRLRGTIPEVFLNALWDSLGRFKREQGQSRGVALERLSRVCFVGEHFRHDFDSVSEEEVVESGTRARDFLVALLGGVDQFLQERVLLDLSDTGEETVEVSSQLLPPVTGTGFTYQRSSRVEPQFKFSVILETEDGEVFRQQYVWPIPANHHSRLVISLFEWVYQLFRKSESALPVFSAPFVAEMYMAKDEDEAARLLGLCIGKGGRMVDLLSLVPDLESRERNKVLALSFAYQQFVRCVLENGFYSALEDVYPDLRRAYRDVVKEHLARSTESVLGPFLLKAFLFLPHGNVAESALWNDYLTGAVVTPLHPAMLDMMLHQSIYLTTVFSDSAERALRSVSTRAFTARHFDRIIDLAKIQRPLYGILSDVNKNLDTNIKSLGYVHMLGDPTEQISKLAAKVLLEEDVAEEDEDEIDDAGLFRETRTSRLIYQTLYDYCELYPFAKDGINIGVYCGGEIQPLIAGIDDYIKLVASEANQPYSLQLTIFSDGIDDYSVLRWVNAWKDRWQVAELGSAKRHYENCQISIKYRVIARKDGFEQFQRVIGQDEYDVFYFIDFIRSTASQFHPVEPLVLPDDYQKFPIVEKVSSPMAWGGKKHQRERVLTNPRFQLNGLHAQVMASLKQFSVDGQQHVIISTSDFEPWAPIVDKTYEYSGWVVCIDPSIDEQLLRSTAAELHKREIIAFGTGVGSHGEMNFTISTDQFSMGDIEKRVSTVISQDLGLADEESANTIAAALVREAAEIAGLSVVKATGGARFVRELIANAVARKALKKDANAFCDELISLDAFLHWFDDPMEERRPDLLRIRAEIVNGYFDITLQLVECKLAKQFEGYLEKAREQVESGLRELVGKFKPRRSARPDDYERTDQRYWWIQLHRLVSTHGRTTKAEYDETLAALERLSEGLFTVRWQAGVLAIWTDYPSSHLSSSATWEYHSDYGLFPIKVATAGMEFVREVSLKGYETDFLADILPVVFSSQEMVFAPPADSAALVADTDESDLGRGRSYSREVGDEAMPPKQSEDQPPQPTPADCVSQVQVRPHGFERILLGSGTAGGRDAYWEFGHPGLPNRHILVFGASGTGKTYLIQALMCELAKLGRNTLVFDYTAGFTNSQLEDVVMTKLNPKQHFVKVTPLEVNPFRRQVNFIDDVGIEEDAATIAGRVSGVFDEVYQLGDQQRAALYRAIGNGVRAKGDRFTLRDMIHELERTSARGGPFGSAAAGVISKIQPFVDTNPFGAERPESWEHLFTDEQSRVHIIQLTGFMKNAARLITEFSLIDLYWYYRSQGDQNKPRIIVLDEIQNLSHKLESPLGQFLTEGRKFGISLILATQTLSNLEKEERDRLFQASHKVFFRPADTEIRAFSQILADSTGRKAEEWVARLSSLKRGECYSLGYAFSEQTGSLEVNRYFRIRVTSLEQRVLVLEIE